MSSGVTFNTGVLATQMPRSRAYDLARGSMNSDARSAWNLETLFPVKQSVYLVHMSSTAGTASLRDFVSTKRTAHTMERSRPTVSSHFAVSGRTSGPAPLGAMPSRSPDAAAGVVVAPPWLPAMASFSVRVASSAS